jgi:hypothetical protein
MIDQERYESIKLIPEGRMVQILPPQPKRTPQERCPFFILQYKTERWCLHFYPFSDKIGYIDFYSRFHEKQ